MAKRKRFRLRSKPIKPNRLKSIEEKHELFDGDDLSDYQGFHVDVEYDYSPYERNNYYYAVKTRPETDEEYKVRLDKYEKELANWEKWFEKNKEAIQREKELRVTEEKAKEEKDALKLKKHLEKKQREIAKELKKLGKQ